MQHFASYEKMKQFEYLVSRETCTSFYFDETDFANFKKNANIGFGSGQSGSNYTGKVHRSSNKNAFLHLSAPMNEGERIRYCSIPVKLYRKSKLYFNPKCPFFYPTAPRNGGGDGFGFFLN